MTILRKAHPGRESAHQKPKRSDFRKKEKDQNTNKVKIMRSCNLDIS